MDHQRGNGAATKTKQKIRKSVTATHQEKRNIKKIFGKEAVLADVGGSTGPATRTCLTHVNPRESDTEHKSCLTLPFGEDEDEEKMKKKKKNYLESGRGGRAHTRRSKLQRRHEHKQRHVSSLRLADCCDCSRATSWSLLSTHTPTPTQHHTTFGACPRRSFISSRAASLHLFFLLAAANRKSHPRTRACASCKRAAYTAHRGLTQADSQGSKDREIKLQMTRRARFSFLGSWRASSGAVR